MKLKPQKNNFRTTLGNSKKIFPRWDVEYILELYQKEKGTNSIAIRGLPKPGEADEDTDLVNHALAEINCADIKPIQVSRQVSFQPYTK